MKKTWIKIKRGILEPKHITKLGAAWYLYFYILDQADWETGTIREWKDEYAAQELGKNLYLIRDHRRLLEKEGYIRSQQEQHGQTIIIHNWTDPRRYDGIVQNPNNQGEDIPPPSNVQGEGQGEGQGEIDQAQISVPSYSHISHITVNAETPDFRTLGLKLSYKVWEIKFYKEITGIDPGLQQCYVIYDLLHGKNPDKESMQRAWKEWVKRGYKFNNLSWIDWGLAGAIPDREGNFPKAVAPEKKAEWDERLAAAEKRQAEEKARKIEEAKRLYSQLPPKFEETMAKLAAEKSI